MKLTKNKLDKFLFKNTSRLVLYLVKKWKYKKSKYRIFVWLHNIIIISYALIGVFLVPLLKRLNNEDMFLIVVFIGIFSLLTLGEIIRRSNYVNRANEYEFIFQLRKNPKVYKEVKDLLQKLFKENKEYRYAYMMVDICYWILMTSLFLMSPNLLGLTFVLRSLFCFVETYINYIFDFEPPDEEKKKAHDELTEIEKRSWRDFLRQPGLGLN